MHVRLRTKHAVEVSGAKKMFVLQGGALPSHTRFCIDPDGDKFCVLWCFAELGFCCGKQQLFEKRFCSARATCGDVVVSDRCDFRKWIDYCTALMRALFAALCWSVGVFLSDDGGVRFSGEVLGFENLVYGVFEFVHGLIETTKFRSTVRKSLDELLYYVLHYMQITEEQVLSLSLTIVRRVATCEHTATLFAGDEKL